jgi:triacylglycerol esterase/lipase EstA (alpha/beta hydrolase family)
MKTDLAGRCIALAMSLLMGCSAAAMERGETEQGSIAPYGADQSEPAPSPLAQAARETLPILLLHGAAGFDQIGPLEYYYDVADTLADDGHDVFTTQVDPLQTIDVRAAQLTEQLDAVLAETGAERVHLVAHSQGGLDARYLISTLGYGDRVATLTTISTPHRGSRVADIALGILPGQAEQTLGFLIDLLVGAIDGDEQDVVGQLYQLTEEFQVSEFDPANPDDPRVEYFSVAGRTQTNPFTNPFTTDLCDPLLVAGYFLLRSSGPNDGLVTVTSATRGTLLGTMPADHLDEVGQLFGTTALGFDHRDFYLELARFLTDPDAPAPL